MSPCNRERNIFILRIATFRVVRVPFIRVDAVPSLAWYLWLVASDPHASPLTFLLYGKTLIFCGVLHFFTAW